MGIDLCGTGQVEGSVVNWGQVEVRVEHKLVTVRVWVGLYTKHGSQSKVLTKIAEQTCKITRSPEQN